MNNIVPEKLNQIPWEGFAVEKEKNLPPEYYNTMTILCDQDLTLLNAKKDTCQIVKAKVKILNRFLNYLRNRSGLNIQFFLLTQRPADIFFDDETKDIYGPLLEIDGHQSGDEKLIFSEFGAVSLKSPDGWKTHRMEINDAILDGADKDVKTLMQLLHKEDIISENGEPDYPRYKYRKEPGVNCFFGLQKHNNVSMDENEKKDLAEKVEGIIEKSDKIKGKIKVRVKEDVDCIPNIIDDKTKALGVEEIINRMHNQGFDWFGREHIVLIDDKFHAAGAAFKDLLLHGGKTGTQQNADDKAKEVMHDIEGVDLDGIVSEHQIFLGTLDCIWQVVMGTPLPKKQIRWIKRELQEA